MSDKGNDLISRCKLFNALAPVQTLGEAYGVIQGMPTVDAVPVIRCRDCIRYRSDDEVWGRCTVMPYRMRKNDYCSYGVIDDMRKDGDDGKTD